MHQQVRETLECRLHLYGPNILELNPVDYTIGEEGLQKQVHHDRKSDIGDQLKQAIMLEWRALVALPTRHAQRSLITAPVKRDVVCCVSWIRMADTRNKCFTNCRYCKIITTSRRTTQAAAYGVYCPDTVAHCMCSLSLGWPSHQSSKTAS